jgi:energy-coupling factor transport system permease protein
MTLLDPYAEQVERHPVRFLHRLNPLAKIAAPLPAMVLLILARDVATPVAFLAIGLLLVLVGAHVAPRTALLLLVGLPALMLVLSLSFGLWTDASRVDSSVTLLRVGDYRFSLGMWLIGIATAVRLGSILVLALLAGLSSSGPDLVRAMVQQLRVPYRIGYTALAAFRFVPRFGHELDVIRQAHRVRGMAGGPGPIAGITRYLGYVVPLLAGAIRHAERVALAMDSRAFGAHPGRTERYSVPFRVRDWVFVFAFWAVTAAVFVILPRLELP